MKKHLNTLFVTTQNAYLHREGEAVLVEVERETKMRLPIHTIGGIVCFGHVLCSPSLMQLCGERNVLISFLSEHGRFMGRVQGAVSGNVLLRREQYRRAEIEQRCVEIAIPVVAAKIANCRTVLQRALRDHPDHAKREETEAAAKRLGAMLGELEQEKGLDVLRGKEGDAARTYFSVFDHLITSQKEDFRFEKRSRRPPLDNINALLSFLYTILLHDAISALEAVGLDPAVGFLHKDRPGRPGLALDLMEEFRPFLADRIALSLVNRNQIKGKGFKKYETGGVVMDDNTRKEVLVAYQARKQEEIVHPFIEETTTVGLLVHLQARLLSRFLRGDIDAYPAFVVRQGKPGLRGKEGRCLRET